MALSPVSADKINVTSLSNKIHSTERKMEGEGRIMLTGRMKEENGRDKDNVENQKEKQERKKG